MYVIFIITFIYIAFRMPQLLAEICATMIGMQLVIANRCARQKLLEIARPAGTADWARRPSRVERRALKRGLNAALDLTEFTSLLPHVAARAHRFVER